MVPGWTSTYVLYTEFEMWFEPLRKWILNKWYFCFHNTPYASLSIPGINVDSSNLVLWENAIFLTLRHLRGNDSPQWGIPPLSSHAVHSRGHQTLYYSLHPSFCCLMKITTFFVSEVQNIVLTRKKQIKTRSRDSQQGRSKEVTAIIPNRFSEPKAAAKLHLISKK